MKYLLSEISMLWKTRQIRFNLALNLCYDFVENWTKLYSTVLDVVTNPLLLVVINWALSLIKARDNKALIKP